MKRFSLVIVHFPGTADIADFREICRKIEAEAPDIAAYIAVNRSPNSATMRNAAKLPSLIVGQGPIDDLRITRGRVLQGRLIQKDDQLRLMEAAGVPVPRWSVLTPGLVLNEAEWGEHVVLKPMSLRHSSRGFGITLMRTGRVVYRAPHEYPEDHPGRYAPMLVQKFINSGEYPFLVRVLTYLGEPICCYRIRMLAKRPPLDSSDREIESAMIASQQGDRNLALEEPSQYRSLTDLVQKSLPEVPVKGIDVIIEESTGKMFVLECNPGGNSWAISSTIGLRARVALAQGIGVTENQSAVGREMLINQMGALDVAARRLIELTRELAQ